MSAPSSAAKSASSSRGMVVLIDEAAAISASAAEAALTVYKFEMWMAAIGVLCYKLAQRLKLRNLSLYEGRRL